MPHKSDVIQTCPVQMCPGDQSHPPSLYNPISKGSRPSSKGPKVSGHVLITLVAAQSCQDTFGLLRGYPGWFKGVRTDLGRQTDDHLDSFGSRYRDGEREHIKQIAFGPSSKNTNGCTYFQSGEFTQIFHLTASAIHRLIYQSLELVRAPKCTGTTQRQLPQSTMRYAFTAQNPG